MAGGSILAIGAITIVAHEAPERRRVFGTLPLTVLDHVPIPAESELKMRARGGATVIVTGEGGVGKTQLVSCKVVPLTIC